LPGLFVDFQGDWLSAQLSMQAVVAKLKRKWAGKIVREWLGENPSPRI
jgi:hypothetical protein